MLKAIIARSNKKQLENRMVAVILKVSDYIKLLNSLFVRDVLLNSSIPPFQNFFTKSENLHQHNTRHAQQNSVILSQRNSVFYGIKSIQHQAATTWNQLQNEVNLDLLQNLRSKTKEYITTNILNTY